MYFNRHNTLINGITKKYNITQRQFRYIEAIHEMNKNGLYPNNVTIHKVLNFTNYPNTFLGELMTLVKRGFIERYKRGQYVVTDHSIMILDNYHRQFRNIRNTRQFEVHLWA